MNRDAFVFHPQTASQREIMESHDKAFLLARIRSFYAVKQQCQWTLVKI